MGKDAFTVKLADFGLSILATNSSSASEYPVSGAFRWKAPECLLGSPPTFASDSYSFGMCIIEAVTGEYPWRNSVGDDVVKCNVTEKRQLPRRPAAFLGVEWELIERMCCFNPGERIGALAVIQSMKRIQQWFSLGYLVEGGGECSLGSVRRCKDLQQGRLNGL
ncbi:hypothetical protein PHYSODRAFT_295212 [Phytophthora sojae]|uniref:Protein kinase domain-containing protein n=1 Tax=Phytophthora sojae (strain P6497) TaxID=1094619 RepID=G4YNK6_PHYSP|nr:hypothetical protein PHYSODRAFT_295212 [Phytophthora sojae]EGZ30405.1 hypothetical protein PHYSODRAFT_295212 [Phytophthora sojae]|eukprot:XP_009517680.1 hypothetical protein PHYSODRAFT_295212 [Phytophthora sojae]